MAELPMRRHAAQALFPKLQTPAGADADFIARRFRGVIDAALPSPDA